MKRKLLIIAMGGYFSASLGNISPTGFEQFNYNSYFVETGTYMGSGIKFALRARFKNIISIEISREFAEKVRKEFAQLPRVQVIHGDSGEILWDVIKDINQPITFWLDGHQNPPVEGAKNTPLLEELDQIARHPIKAHTILIDDMHCLNTALFDFISRDDLIRKIKAINPNYTISYVDGGDSGEYPNNVMVARVNTAV